jgi:hypothetical protein
MPSGPANAVGQIDEKPRRSALLGIVPLSA